MVYLVILLLISHIAALYFINKYINKYKINNYNYLNGELKKLYELFLEGITSIDHNVNTLTKRTAQSFENLKFENTEFIKSHKNKFNEVTTFIKNDYSSLAEMLAAKNEILGKLLQKTEENITNNTALRPILISSNQELEKVYGKIKQLITTYEKSLNDIKVEMENVLYKVETTIDGKIKQLAASGEKTMLASVEQSKITIAKVTQETNNGLKTVLHENQIKLLTEKVENLNNEFGKGLSDMLSSVNELDKVFLNILKEEKGKEGDKKGFFKF